MNLKASFIIFKGLSLKQIKYFFLEGESESRTLITKIVLGIIKRVEQFQQNVFDRVNCRPEHDYIAKLKMNYRRKFLQQGNSNKNFLYENFPNLLRKTLV